MLKYLTSKHNLRLNVIEPKETGEWVTTFIMDKEEYEKIWQDKEFILEVSPMKSEESKDISKGKREEIILPD